MLKDPKVLAVIVTVAVLLIGVFTGVDVKKMICEVPPISNTQ